jgi:2-keto-4-pentenoate hydratase
MRNGITMIGVILLCSMPPAAGAACPGDAAIAAYVADFKAGQSSKGFGKDISMADAACARAKLAQALTRILGPAVGYKAVFTHADSQKRFAVDGPAWGVMFGNRMMPDGARVPAQFGALPRYEADFLVVVRDAGLADARNPRAAMDHISALIPFIELPDIMLDGKPTGAELVAANAAFRGGVLGPRIAVSDNNAAVLLEALANMEVVVTEERSGTEIGRARGNVLMGNPINAALWLAQALKKDGVILKPGDLLSLGGFLAAAPVRAGTSMSVHYTGLPENPTVTIHFD